jgi:hypothetical protein
MSLQSHMANGCIVWQCSVHECFSWWWCALMFSMQGAKILSAGLCL